MAIEDFVAESLAEMEQPDPGTPEAVSATEAQPDNAQATGETPSTETTEPGGSGPSAFSERFDPNALAPELQPAYKQMQADYTRKMQEIAEQRRQQEAYGNVDPVTLQTAAHVQKMLAEDPAQAAQWFAQQAQYLQGLGPQAEADPLQEYLPQTDGEALLLQQVQQQQRQMAELKQFQQSMQAQQAAQAVDAEFRALEGKAGREIPQSEREQIVAAARKLGAQSVDAIPMVWRALQFDEAVKQAEQKGRDHASKIVQQKASAAPAPGGLANRAGQGSEAPLSLDALVRAEAAAAGIR